MAATKTGKLVRPLGNPRPGAFALPTPRRSATWVFPNKTDQGSTDLKKQVAAPFNLAELQDARSHDLRRTFASATADEGYSDAIIAALLSHSQRSITARHYIRRPDEALVAAADRTARRLLAVMAGTTAEVVPLQRSY